MKDGLAKYKQIIKDSLDNVKDQLISRFNEIRGNLIADIIKEVRTLTFLPNQLGNVYSTKFRQMSIQNFLGGLGNDLFDQAAKDVTNFAMDKTNIFKTFYGDDTTLGKIDGDY